MFNLLLICFVIDAVGECRFSLYINLMPLKIYIPLITDIVYQAVISLECL